MSVTYPRGFRAAGVTAGFKASGKSDVALVVNDGPSSAAAAVFTSNRCLAHPVIWSQEAIKTGSARAVVLNSGGANCYTGPEGYAATHRTAELVAELGGWDAIDSQVCSTGIIGHPLSEELIVKGVRLAFDALNFEGGPAAAEAIMTTDTVNKQAIRTLGGEEPGGGAGAGPDDGGGERPGGGAGAGSDDGGGEKSSREVRIGGMAKGAGMLAPALATMLVVVTTDANLPSDVLDRALRSATSQSFDRLDSDGCQSTNDTVLLMASGASGITPDEAEFTAALTELCVDLAMQLLADAEGADHEITITTTGAVSDDDALEVGRAVARSNLFKTAIYGKDPNWGRILASVGTTRAQFDPHDLDVAVNGVWVCRNSGVGESPELVDLEPRHVAVTIDLKSGAHEASIWTNDLTHAYVHENSAYTT